MYHGIPTPPTTPEPQQSYRPPPPPKAVTTPQDRLGVLLGDSLRIISIIGTGAYGVVYKAVDEFTGIPYAVKALSKTNPDGSPLDTRQRDFQAREIQLHYAASAHPNVVSMLKIVDDPECTYVVLEFCQEGDLFSNITERCRYVGNDALVKKAFGQILDAVEHCHRLGIYHRDLKPENILVSNAGNEVLLADFGLATTERYSEDHGCGSTFYMSPECLDQASRKPRYECAPNDIWSLGVILVNLTCGRNPWKQASVEDPTYKAFSKNSQFLKTILPLSNELNEILCWIFERNPEDRPTVAELRRQIMSCHSFGPPQQDTPPSTPIMSAEPSLMSDAGTDGSGRSSPCSPFSPRTPPPPQQNVPNSKLPSATDYVLQEFPPQPWKNKPCPQWVHSQPHVYYPQPYALHPPSYFGNFAEHLEVRQYFPSPSSLQW